MIFSPARSPLAVPSIVYEHPDPAAFFDGMSFDPTGKLGWLMGDPIKGKVQFLITDDSGATWKPLPEERSPSLADGVAAFAANGTHLLNPNRETVIVGLPKISHPTGFRSVVVSVARDDDRSLLITTGPSGTDQSTDGGESWSPVSRTGFHTLSFVSRFTLWAAGSDGQVARWRHDRLEQ